MSAGVSQSDHDFRLLFESHPEPMWVYDLDTLAFLEVNDAAVQGEHSSASQTTRGSRFRPTFAVVQRPSMCQV